MNNQLKKGVIEIAVLNYLSKEEMYGYQVVQKLEPHINVKESSVYLILSRLYQSNYLNYRLEQQGKREIKYYYLTNLGKEYLEQQNNNWLQISNLVAESRN